MKRIVLLASAVAVCFIGVASAKAGPVPSQHVTHKQVICYLGKRGHHSGCVTVLTIGFVAE